MILDLLFWLIIRKLQPSLIPEEQRTGVSFYNMQCCGILHAQHVRLSPISYAKLLTTPMEQL